MWMTYWITRVDTISEIVKFVSIILLVTNFIEFILFRILCRMG